jgi:hypothetical protein
MIFHFEMSSNEVKRNTKFVLLISSSFSNTSTPIDECNFRNSLAFFTVRTGHLMDSRKYENWHRANDMYLKPRESESL